MAYTISASIGLGSTKAGLTLNGQLIDTAGADVGSAITTGFVDTGAGGYLLTATIPGGHRGGIKIYQSGVPGTMLCPPIPINPQETEYSDIATSSRSDLTAAQILTMALTESYAADGAAPTLTQILYAIQQFLQERVISGVTMTVKKIDGSATAMTFTLDNAVSPTSITRTT